LRSWDGGLRAYDSKTGKILWVLDTNKEFPTVNGVKATGGSMDGAGPIIVDGMLYVVAGNGGPFGSAGNVLLAFALE
jgi:polyvinyl alcohol dehydrogenase (cytochrome)